MSKNLSGVPLISSSQFSSVAIPQNFARYEIHCYGLNNIDNLLSILEPLNSTKTRGETVVVGYHYRWVQGLEVNNHYWVRVELRLWF
jgi:hypothetical protein